MDRLLDRGANGPLYLRRREIAELVMPNLVHLLVTPEWLGSHGQAFSQDESYDHLVRSAAEFDRIRATEAQE